MGDYILNILERVVEKRNAAEIFQQRRPNSVGKCHFYNLKSGRHAVGMTSAIRHQNGVDNGTIRGNFKTLKFFFCKFLPMLKRLQRGVGMSFTGAMPTPF